VETFALAREKLKDANVKLLIRALRIREGLEFILHFGPQPHGPGRESFIHGKLILVRTLSGACRRQDTAESKVISPGVNLAFAARANDVTRAVLIVAKE
jgi:hypothetical protein